MRWASVAFLLATLIMLAFLVVVAVRTYRRANRERMESPKYRMLDED